MIDFHCPKCGREMHAPDEFAGKTGKCKGCGDSVAVPIIATKEPQTPTVLGGFTESALNLLKSATPGAISTRVNQPREIATVEDEQLTPCPFCAEPIRKQAKKCKHCGEILDIVLREANRTPAPGPAVHVHQTVSTTTAVVGGYSRKRWSRLVAFILSVIPGAGQLYKGQPLNAVAWFVVVMIGYAAYIIPGLVLHACCALGAASGDEYR